MNSLHLIAHWNPDDDAFWRRAGRRVAQRNLVLSVATLMLAFAVWMLWSVVVVHLPAAGFRFSINQLFWLAALPALSGATLRVVYAFAVPAFGGRRWTALSTASLLVPALGMGFALADPDTPYEVLVGLALLCGLGGGNFASSMAHVSALYPRDRAGRALGLNAGFGNLGVALAQALVPAVITFSLFGDAGFGSAPTNASADAHPAAAPMWLHNAGFVWVPLILAGTVAAWFGMNDLAEARSTFGEQAVVFRRKHAWMTCWLYLGTFGSFIGFAAGLPLLLSSHYPGSGLAALAWLGPLVGAALHPLGGRLAERHGGARVTLGCLVAMLIGTLGVMHMLPQAAGAVGAGGVAGAAAAMGAVGAAGAAGTAGSASTAGTPVAAAAVHVATAPPGAPGAAGPAAVLAGFIVLFAAAGMGSSSVFRMIPRVFTRLHEHAGGAGAARREAARRQAHTEATASLGLSSAIAAYGGFALPKSLGTSLAWTGSVAPALAAFAVFYLSCIALAWWHYGRPGAALPC